MSSRPVSVGQSPAHVPVLVSTLVSGYEFEYGAGPWPLLSPRQGTRRAGLAERVAMRVLKGAACYAIGTRWVWWWT